MPEALFDGIRSEVVGLLRGRASGVRSLMRRSQFLGSLCDFEDRERDDV